MGNFVIGVDVGQVHDPTALALVEFFDTPMLKRGFSGVENGAAASAVLAGAMLAVLAAGAGASPGRSSPTLADNRCDNEPSREDASCR